MCGLAGIYNLDGTPVDTRKLLQMTRLIRHRGPDDEGFLLADIHQGMVTRHSSEDSIEEVRLQWPNLPTESRSNLGMGFRRLSIIDLSARGHQPMSDPEQTCFLCFNGQIYNYVEIRAELMGLGYTFKSQSDSEVLLQSYLHWGSSCLEKFIGMFAFAIFDKTNKRLFVARDRLGIKPLMYYFDGKSFIWGSEEKQFTHSGIIQSVLNENVMLDFLRDIKLFEHPDSFIQNVQQLPAACYAFVDQNGIRLNRYWSLHPGQADLSKTEEMWKSQISDMLKDSVKLRLRSDVPLGIALSGGIDSSSISCLARELSPNVINTFSVYYEGSPYDERVYIKSVIEKGGINPNYYTAKNEISIEEVAKWIYHQDAPASGASPFSAFQNYKNVRSAGITVLLNGQGGDELFAGYPYFLKYFIADLYGKRNLNGLISNLGHLLKDQGPVTCLKQIYLAKNLIHGNPVSIRHLEYRKYATPELFPREIDQRYNQSEHPLQTQSSDSSYLETALIAAITQTHLPHMLRWEDRNSMANSIESRVPFLDHRLVEKSMQIPVSLKIRKGVQKYILREAMRNIVPELILKRKDKIGFGTPTVEWTTTQLYEPIRELLHSSSFLSRTWIHGKKVTALLEKNPKRFGENELWRIMSAELWHRTFIDKN